MTFAGDKTVSATRPLQVGGQGLARLLATQLLQELGADLAGSPCAAAAEQEQIAWMDSGLAGFGARPSYSVPLASMADAVVLAINALLTKPGLVLCGRRALGMRRISHDLQPPGMISANRSCRLLTTQDGLLAVNLPRGSDWALLPAWLETDVATDWHSLAQVLRRWPVQQALQRARWLGLAVAPSETAVQRAWGSAQRLAAAAGDEPAVRRFRVLDLSNLWAGPLCSWVLQQAGAEVIRIENPQRPDGARYGPAAFFDGLNKGKTTLSLDLQQAADRERLHALLASSDLLIESARPRGLQQLGLQAEDLLLRYPGLSWLSITGYGRDEEQGQWIAFGDDAAVAGGLAQETAQVQGRPQFCGDAIADPLAGLHAAVLALSAMQTGGGYLLSVALRDVVSSLIWRGRVLAEN